MVHRPASAHEQAARLAALAIRARAPHPHWPADVPVRWGGNQAPLADATLHATLTQVTEPTHVEVLWDGEALTLLARPGTFALRQVAPSMLVALTGEAADEHARTVLVTCAGRYVALSRADVALYEALFPLLLVPTLGAWDVAQGGVADFHLPPELLAGIRYVVALGQPHGTRAHAPLRRADEPWREA